MTAVKTYLCPSDSPPGDRRDWTNYAGCAGANKGWGFGITEQNGMFNRDAVINMASIQDGTSNTLMMGEIITTDQGAAALTPTQLAVVRDVGDVSGSNGNPNAWPAITLADVTTWGNAGIATTDYNGNRVGERWYRGQQGRNAFTTLLTPNSRFPNMTFHCNNCNYDGRGAHGARSKHKGGVQFVLADGSVRMISENVDWTTYQRLGHRTDGQTVGEF